MHSPVKLGTNTLCFDVAIDGYGKKYKDWHVSLDSVLWCLRHELNGLSLLR